jgi:hypothetical protein
MHTIYDGKNSLVSEKLALSGILKILRELDISDLTVAAVNDLLRFFALAEDLEILPERSLPLNKIIQIFAHNSGNTMLTGLTSILPNQIMNIPKLLARGVRGFELDVYLNKYNDFVVAHGIPNPFDSLKYFVGDNVSIRDYFAQLKEFLVANPREFIAIKLEDCFVGTEANKSSFMQIVAEFFPQTEILSWGDIENYQSSYNTTDLPSIDWASSCGKKIMIMAQKMVHSSLIASGYRNPYTPFPISNFEDVLTSVVPGGAPCVFEDGTKIGQLLGAMKRVPGLNYLVSNSPLASSTSRLTPENLGKLLHKLEATGSGGIIGIDKIGVSGESLKYISVSPFGLSSEPLILIPTVLMFSILSAQLSKKDVPDYFKTAAQIFIDICFPGEYSYLFGAAQSVLTEFNDESKKQIYEEIKKPIHGQLRNLFGKALDGFWKVAKRKEVAPLLGSLITEEVLMGALGLSAPPAALFILNQIFGNLLLCAASHTIEAAKKTVAANAEPIMSTAREAFDKIQGFDLSDDEEDEEKQNRPSISKAFK